MNPQATLSRREAEIAEYIVWGASKKEIADKLFISTRTVETTARTIYEKVGVQKATELSVWFFCTRFNISFDLSPLKRSVVAISLLIIFLPFELSSQQDVIRPNRNRSREVCSARRKDDSISDYTLEF